MVILYYLSLASLLTKKVVNCKQSIKLIKCLFLLNEKNKGNSSMVANYYFAKTKNLEKLLSKLPKTL